MTMASDSKFHLRAAGLGDVTAIARVWTSAFFDDEIIGHLMHPHRIDYPDDVYWFLLRGIRERFWDWRHQFIVAVDEKGKVVGAADWRRLGKGGEKRELWTMDPSECEVERKISSKVTDVWRRKHYRATAKDVS
jgi:hypothetical protein